MVVDGRRDCYFFQNSACFKASNSKVLDNNGETSPFGETFCFWEQNGGCLRSDCTNKHMTSEKKYTKASTKPASHSRENSNPSIELGDALISRNSSSIGNFLTSKMFSTQKINNPTNVLKNSFNIPDLNNSGVDNPIVTSSFNFNSALISSREDKFNNITDLNNNRSKTGSHLLGGGNNVQNIDQLEKDKKVNDLVSAKLASNSTVPGHSILPLNHIKNIFNKSILGKSGASNTNMFGAVNKGANSNKPKADVSSLNNAALAAGADKLNGNLSADKHKGNVVADKLKGIPGTLLLKNKKLANSVLPGIGYKRGIGQLIDVSKPRVKAKKHAEKVGEIKVKSLAEILAEKRAKKALAHAEKSVAGMVPPPTVAVAAATTASTPLRQQGVGKLFSGAHSEAAMKSAVSQSPKNTVGGGDMDDLVLRIAPKIDGNVMNSGGMHTDSGSLSGIHMITGIDSAVVRSASHSSSSGSGFVKSASTSNMQVDKSNIGTIFFFLLYV
ncbi:hypothetical protein AYI69_g3038 [Smittium culicis]|uniref:Uncharacterized protein n=1 Tax=Smittium culicis TaxID=133412 RepID=A0A1R1YLC9_9FUNG|nr:hypothetical protein AYI69_g3038 [Smittium culicis]